MTQKRITPEEIDGAIQKLRFPKPKMSSDEAAKRAVALFTEWPASNHCASSTIIVLQEAYDLDGGALPAWIAAGFRGGVCLGEVCGALSGAVMAMGLMAYKVLEPKTEYEQKIACEAIVSYVHDLAYIFNYKFGSVQCRVLTRRLGIDMTEREILYRTKIGKDICSPFVDFVVRTMVKWGEVSQEPPPRVLPYALPLKLS